MDRCLIILAVIALVFPPEITEAGVAAFDESRQGMVQFCPEEINTTTEGETVESDLYFWGMLCFEQHVQLDGRLPLCWGDSVVVAAVDPQGCRPPPLA